MAVFYNPEDIRQLSEKYLMIDTNILVICMSDETFLTEFTDLFKENTRLIDPIVHLEYLRNAYTDMLYQKKLKFLQFHEFYEMTDNQQPKRASWRFAHYRTIKTVSFNSFTCNIGSARLYYLTIR